MLTATLQQPTSRLLLQKVIQLMQGSLTADQGSRIQKV